MLQLRSLLSFVAVFVAGTAFAAHPVVPGFERFFANDKADVVKGGQLLLTELNCVACHVPQDASLGGKQAPILDNVATRVKTGFLRKFIADPHGTKPGTTMPDLFSGDAEKAKKVEALVHFLASTGSLRQEPPDNKGIGAGRKLFAEVGCVVCHGSRNPAAQPDKSFPSTVPLPDLKAKYSISSLAAFLENPHQARPAGRMPKLLNQKEAKDVANYLLQGLKVDLSNSPGASNYAYYEGNFDTLPDFDKLKPKEKGRAGAFDLTASRRESNYALKFDGFFELPRAGAYRFNLNSDDGSKLYIDGKLVVDNDGIHPPQSKSGSAELAKGLHTVTVTFFQGGGGAELGVYIEGPGLAMQNFAPMVAATEAGLVKKEPEPVKKDDPDHLYINPALVAEGKALFASAGCANCHQMTVDKKPIAPTLKSPKLDGLKKLDGRSCLTNAVPPQGLPNYALSKQQVQSISAALQKPLEATKDPKEQIARTMMAFNCYACHERDKIGGPEETLNKAFVTTQPEMGDEGRVPPPLNNVGAKLNADYVKQILDKGAHDRTYMLVRMPGFGNANVGHLVDAFAAVDKFPSVPSVEFTESIPKVKATARHMVGDLALGCVKCHTFAGQKAEGVQGIDMAIMTKRLQREWFHAYLIDPQKVRPGTRMPTAWPNGKSVLPDLLGGKTDVQVEAIWTYLKDGTSANLPIGSRKQFIPLTPTTNAIIYRNFIEGSGPRAIGVGYPEKLNLTFDANELRLSMIWQGAFIDASRHWTDRGVGYEPPLGDNILHLPRGPDLAVLSKPDQNWPTTSLKDQGYKFKGYRLNTTDDRPTFLYSIGDIQIEDFPNPKASGKDHVLSRTLTISGQAAEGLTFRAASANKIEAAADGWYKIDGWTMRIEADAKPEIRKSGNKSELIVPVRLKDGKARIVQEYAW